MLGDRESRVVPLLLEQHEPGDAVGELPDVFDHALASEPGHQPIEGFVGAIVGRPAPTPIEEFLEREAQLLVLRGRPIGVGVEPLEQSRERLRRNRSDAWCADVTHRLEDGLCRHSGCRRSFCHEPLWRPAQQIIPYRH